LLENVLIDYNYLISTDETEFTSFTD